VFCAGFLQLQFGFAIFCQKEIGKKVAHKVLVKLITGEVVAGAELAQLGHGVAIPGVHVGGVQHCITLTTEMAVVKNYQCQQIGLLYFRDLESNLIKVAKLLFLGHF